MTFLPVVERELRVAARRRGTYFGRVATAGVALCLSLWIILVGDNASSQLSGDMFGVLTVLLFIYAGIGGAFVTADCLSEEKREGTLGLLFLTDLKGYDVVFGKLAATSLNSFYGLLAVVPVLSIPLLMGGVSQDELMRVVLMVINLLCFSLSIGIWASAMCKRAGRAHGLAIIVVMALLFAWPFATQIRHHPVADNRLAYLPSPLYGCALAFDTNYTTGQQLDFWLNALITQIYAWVFLGTACWLAPRSWQDTVAEKRSWWRSRGSFASEARTRLLEANPYRWRALRPRAKTIAVWLIPVLMAAFWFWLHWINGNWLTPFSDRFFEPVSDLISLILAGLAIKGWVALESGRALGEDRRNGALELILSTSIKPAEIVKGQRQALWRQFGGPIGFLLAVNAFSLMMELRNMPKVGGASVSDDWLEAIAAHAVIGLFLVLDSLALGALGMRLGFRARKPGRAGVMASYWVLMLPGILFFMPGYWILTSSGFDGWSALLFWCILGLGTDLVAIYMHDKLLSEFRLFASEGHKRKPEKTHPFNASPALVEIS